MFTKEMFQFLIKVITSWQVIAVSVFLIFYLTLVSYVARVYHPQRSSDFSFDSKPKKEKAAAAELPESSDDDDLGIEE